jgi:hypothetical protein
MKTGGGGRNTNAIHLEVGVVDCHISIAQVTSSVIVISQCLPFSPLALSPMS